MHVRITIAGTLAVMEKTACYYFCAYAFLLVITCQVPCLAKRNTSIATDQYALVSLKAHITSDPYHVLSRNWTNSSRSVCSWIGVTCGLLHRRVTALNISSMGLSGTIPPQLGNLSFLASLDLNHNFFHGTLPQELSLLGRLKLISVDDNNFDGEIPSWLGLLPKLEHMSLRKNYFTGLIPKSIANASNLQHLDFTNNSLSGKIPEELGRLHNLQILSIQGNHLSGDIPSAIFNMSNLRIIALRANELSGSLPAELCRNLPFLQGFFLGENHLSGQIPSNLSHCEQLQKLWLFDNSFTGILPNDLCGNLSTLNWIGLDYNQISGQLPSNLFHCKHLRILLLPFNNLNGAIPKEIGQLQQLEVLQMANNGLSRTIPAEIFNISTLRVLSIGGNDLSGSLPTIMCHQSHVLEIVALSNNSLSGPIPDSISNCSNLKVISLAVNKFTGFIPQSLGNLRLLEELYLGANNLRNSESSSELTFITSLSTCTSLRILAVNMNPLDGIIPSSIGNLSSSLQTMVLFNCIIRGSLPTGIGNLTNLITLVLGNNELSGNIPLSVKHLHKLQGIDLFNNSMTGSIVEGFCELPTLVELSLGQNQFSGSIPQCLGNLTSLRGINLGSNKLYASIPSSLWNLKDLLNLELSSNSLIGSLPPEIGNLHGAIYINLSSNQLSGSVPTTIGNLQNLINLSLAHNTLSGPFPVSVGSMVSLETLDLSNNNLSGSIPKSLEKLQYLHNFDVSFNALSGEIPTGGPFINFNMESFKGNGALCGIPRFHVPLCHNGHTSSKRKKMGIAFSVLGGVVVLFTLVGLVFTCIRHKRKRKTTSITTELVSTAPERISYFEIMHATQHLNECNVLGNGSFGNVYRGVLRNGKSIAVKVFNLQKEASFKSFDVECEVLRNIRHRNLTKVISSCSNKEFKALVLEYMPNGSLEKWLYSDNYCLDMMQRLKIMIDVASALEYLHHGCSTPIAHCDLKPSNVLLDDEMIGHVSDFSIAKLVGDEESIALTNTLATLGYIAPEYGLEGLVSTRCDVYSYGVMLMETFTRKKPSDDMFGGDLSLKKWVESLVQHSPHDVIDANLVMNLEGEQLEKNVQCISLILELALKCCAESSRDRINMIEVVAKLKKIKIEFS